MVKQIQLNLNLSSPFLLSAALHGGALLLALSLAVPQKSPLPIGVELMYGDVSAIAAPVTAPAPEIAKPTPTTVAQIDKDGVFIDQEKDKKKTQPEPQVQPQVAAEKTLGSPQGTSTQGALTGREGVANGSEVSPEDRYLYELKMLLERRKRYPVMAKRMGHAGKVTMRFKLSADGKLSESEVLEKAPYDSLNKAAEDLVKGIDGMKPFPKEISRHAWVITVPIEFALN